MALCPTWPERRTEWLFGFQALVSCKFVFKIKTKSGGIIGGVLIEAKDIEAAKDKLRQFTEQESESSRSW